MPDGTVLRAEQDADGSMHVHVSKADGTHVRVLLDSNYQVTSVEEFTGGRGGHGRGDQTALTGDALAKATAAAQAAVPDGTVLRAEQDADGSMHVHVSKADGTHVRVLLDSSFQVTSVQDMPARGGRGSGGSSDSSSDSSGSTTGSSTTGNAAYRNA